MKRTLSLAESLGSTKALAVEPILIDRHPHACDFFMELVDPAKETNPRTVQHTTVNGAGLVARILRGKQ